MIESKFNPVKHAEWRDWFRNAMDRHRMPGVVPTWDMMGIEDDVLDKLQETLHSGAEESTGGKDGNG